MASKGWRWANLNSSQMEKLLEGEQTLGADVLMAYSNGVEPGPMRLPIGNLVIAELDESQVECLQGLENNLQAVVVAYRRP